MTNDARTELLIDDLMDRGEHGVPVREMGALLALGRGGAPLVREVLAAELAVDGEFHPGCIYLCAALGELGDPVAAPVLADAVLRDPELTSLMVVAAEALGRIGPDTVREIRRIAVSPLWVHRLWAYFAAGRTRSAEGNALLLAALESDPELADIVALALAESGDPQAIEPLYRALQRCEPWQRPEFEDALRDLHYGVADAEDYDWRVRFRMDGLGVRFPMNWAVIACIVREDGGLREARTTVPVRPLAEILAEPPEVPAPDVCESCGVARWRSTGVPVCPETACSIPALQAHDLLRFAGDPEADLADILDELEDERERRGEARRREAGRRRRGRRSQAREDESTRLHLIHSAGVWATRQGAETVGGAGLMLLDEARRAAREHGDPDDLMRTVDRLDAELSGDLDAFDRFEPAPPAHDPFAGVGRNDPCPCGSGRKFKKCHGDASASRAARVEANPDPFAGGPDPFAGGPDPFAGGRRPQLVTFDDEPVSFARAHYRITDHDAVLAALDACGDLEAGSGAGRYVWHRSEPDGGRRILGSIDARAPDRLALECMSRERLDRGKRLLSDIAGDWLVHRSDTQQDPWQAVAEAQARPARREPEVPPEIAGPAIRQLMDQHYRTWPDEPLPALGGRTPRQAVRDAAGRRAVVELLRTFESGERTQPEPMRYDFGWIWDELGLAGEREPG